MKHLHIVGCPRSGTTLLMELVRTCFHCDAHCEHERSVFGPAPPGAGLYVTKKPTDIKRIARIFSRDPELHVVYIGRDPRAVITSKHPREPGHYFCNYRVWSECDRAARALLGHERFLALRYEDLVADPDKVQEIIAAKFPFLVTRCRFSAYHEHAAPSPAARRAMNGLRRISAGSLDKWRDHLPRVKEQLQRHPQLQADLRRLGYEADDRWQQALEDVEAVDYPCRYPNRRPILKNWEKALRTRLKARRYLKRKQL